jgi:hypothetical protein
MDKKGISGSGIAGTRSIHNKADTIRDITLIRLKHFSFISNIFFDDQTSTFIILIFQKRIQLIKRTSGDRTEPGKLYFSYQTDQIYKAIPDHLSSEIDRSLRCNDLKMDFLPGHAEEFAPYATFYLHQNSLPNEDQTIPDLAAGTMFSNSKPG